MYNLQFPKSCQYSSNSSDTSSGSGSSKNRHSTTHQMPDITKLLDVYDKKVYRKHNHIYYRLICYL